MLLDPFNVSVKIRWAKAGASAVRRLQRILTDTLNGSKGVYRSTDLYQGIMQRIYVTWLHNGHIQRTAAARYAEERCADVAPTDLIKSERIY